MSGPTKTKVVSAKNKVLTASISFHRGMIKDLFRVSVNIANSAPTIYPRAIAQSGPVKKLPKILDSKPIEVTVTKVKVYRNIKRDVQKPKRNPSQYTLSLFTRVLCRMLIFCSSMEIL